MKLPVYNCIIDENPGDDTGVYAISFVDAPANETDFITLSKQEVRLNRDTQKQILTGVVLKPEQLIYRYSPQMGEYYIKFSAQQIEKIANKMMKTGVALHNTTHQHQDTLTGNYLTELWIVENPANDKANALGFRNLPKGTLMCSYKVEDNNYWVKEVMSGNVKGFSLEGLFNQEIALSKINNNTPTQSKKKSMSKPRKNPHLLQKLYNVLMDIDQVQKGDATESGIAYVEFTLKDGKIVKVDADGFATLDDEQMAAGEHPLADGNTLVVDESGNFVETKESSEAGTTPEDATAPEALRRMKRKRFFSSEEKPEDTDTDPKEKQPKDKSKSGSSAEALKQKIAELEEKLNELAQIAEDAKSEVTKLRKVTPSAFPAVARKADKGFTQMNASERIAYSAHLRMQKK